MAFRKMNQPQALVLAATLLISGSAYAQSNNGNPLFAGITSIQATGGNNGQQVIRLDADLPFTYQIQPINANQVAITLKNARLANNLVSQNGVLNLTPGGAVSSGTLGNNDDDVTQEQIILNGPNLGNKRIVIQGPQGVSGTVINPAAVSSSEPAYNAMAFTAPSGYNGGEDVRNMSQTPNWYKPDPHKYDPDPNPDRISKSYTGGFLNLFTRAPKTNATIASNKPSRLSLFTIIHDNHPVDNHDVEQSLVERAHTSPVETAPPVPTYRYAAPTPAQTPTDEAQNEAVTVLATEDSTTQPTNSAPQMPARQNNTRINIDPHAAQRAAQGPTFTYQKQPVRPATVPVAAGPQIQTVNNVSSTSRLPQQAAANTAPINPWNDPNFTPQYTYPQPQYQQPQYPQPQQPQLQQDPATAQNDNQPDDTTADDNAPDNTQPQQPPQEVVRTMPEYKGGSAPISFTVTGYGSTPGQVYTMQPGNPSPNVAAFNNDQPVGALAYADSSDQKARVNALMNKALAAFKANQYDAALDSVQQALELDNKNAELYAAMAEIDLKQKRYSDAKDAYDQAVALDASKNTPRYAQILILAGDRAKAKDILKAMAADTKTTPADKARIDYMLGTLYQENGDMMEAIGYLQNAARFAPKNPDIQYNLGLAYEFAGNLPEAHTHYASAVRLNPKAQDAKNALARTASRKS